MDSSSISYKTWFLLDLSNTIADDESMAKIYNVVYIEINYFPGQILYL